MKGSSISSSCDRPGSRLEAGAVVVPQTLILRHGAIPPSFNQIGTRGQHWQVNKAKKTWEAIFAMLLIEAGMPQHSGGAPVAGRVRAKAYLRFPTNRRRDEDNFSVIIKKSLGDALVGGFTKMPPKPGGKRPRYVRTWPEGRFLPDDTPKFFRFSGVEFEEELGPKRMTLVIRWWPRGPDVEAAA